MFSPFLNFTLLWVLFTCTLLLAEDTKTSLDDSTLTRDYFWQNGPVDSKKVETTYVTWKDILFNQNSPISGVESMLMEEAKGLLFSSGYITYNIRPENQLYTETRILDDFIYEKWLAYWSSHIGHYTDSKYNQRPAFPSFFKN
jgi:hypothetical protein